MRKKLYCYTHKTEVFYFFMVNHVVEIDAIQGQTQQSLVINCESQINKNIYYRYENAALSRTSSKSSEFAVHLIAQ